MFTLQRTAMFKSIGGGVSVMGEGALRHKHTQQLHRFLLFLWGRRNSVTTCKSKGSLEIMFQSEKTVSLQRLLNYVQLLLINNRKHVIVNFIHRIFLN